MLNSSLVISKVSGQPAATPVPYSQQASPPASPAGQVAFKGMLSDISAPSAGMAAADAAGGVRTPAGANAYWNTVALQLAQGVPMETVFPSSFDSSLASSGSPEVNATPEQYINLVLGGKTGGIDILQGSTAQTNADTIAYLEHVMATGSYNPNLAMISSPGAVGSLIQSIRSANSVAAIGSYWTASGPVTARVGAGLPTSAGEIGALSRSGTASPTTAGSTSTSRSTTAGAAKAAPARTPRAPTAALLAAIRARGIAAGHRPTRQQVLATYYRHS